MRVSEDVIVLSSSPGNIISHTPSRLAASSTKLTEISPGCVSPHSPIMSPSELLRNLSGPAVSTDTCLLTDNASNKAKKVSKERGKTQKKSPFFDDCHDAVADGEQNRRKRTMDQLQGKESSKGGLKKTRNGTKDRKTTKAKSGENGNKTLVGKVGKAIATSTDLAGKSELAREPAKSLNRQEPSMISNNAEDGPRLEEAVKRRLDWTPTKDTAQRVIDLGGEGDIERIPLSPGRPGFGNLVSEYGFSGEFQKAKGRTSTESGPTKRRRIELVQSTVLKQNAELVKPKSKRSKKAKDQDSAASNTGQKSRGRKKFTTLTARVTANYTPGDQTDDNISVPDIEKYSDPNDNKCVDILHKSRSRSTANDIESLILPPEAAVKFLEEQDLVFGTCSQLAMEESPTTLREIQQVITASEVCISETRTPKPDAQPSTLTRFATPRNLWHVASRDSDGSFAPAQVIDTVDLTESPLVSTLNRDKDRREKKKEEPSQQAAIFTKDLPLQPASASDSMKNLDTEDPDSQASQVKNSTDKSTSASLEIPRYEGFTTAELSQQISCYGFKAVRNRKKMIELLQKCWISKHGKNMAPEQPCVQRVIDPSDPNDKEVPESKSSTLATELSATVSASVTRRAGNAQPNPATTKKPSRSQSKQESQGKKKQKTAPKCFLDIEEIEDSEDEAFPSPSRLQNRYNTIQSIATEASLTLSTEPCSPKKSTTSQNPDSPGLALQITSAVRAQSQIPRSNSRNRPSWHEKILLFVPIVLEDFATWLNTEGLALVGEDREVSAGFVREWCENQGICCCWRKVVSE
ncbi:hypothetical protein ASPZODRAFT_163144 [Penicilliopsis zonata CBS 506.65]|uniref:Structure-specific endonuclease subunit SLX4 n=1 Tax=Penicilliopsis zonata CBS 506.65 TaxID=1073090 RepID=A0A1L9SVS4_9EURO|nr:hypothetical protein ASPZODRAFT_163144 [Penicilliopsis zonata CBS 506.65]OJJ51288.1 hypothetical protein ASPZODRAFT_163144 [Penicilliopsis zonata CBS 506.65]